MSRRMVSADGGQVSLRVIACRRARAAGRGQPAGFRAVFCRHDAFVHGELQHGQTLLGATLITYFQAVVGAWVPDAVFSAKPES